MNAIIAGPDEDGLGDELASEGVETTAVEDVANRPALERAGIHEADVFVLTDVSQATSIPVAKDLNENLKVVIYAPDSAPEFVRGQSDLIIDPDLLAPEMVAEEIADWD